MKYVSIDIETTGLDPLDHQVIEFGAVIEDTENPLQICGLPSFRALIKHDRIDISPFCLKMHMDTGLLEELTKRQKERPKTWHDFIDGTHICQPSALTPIFKRFLKSNGIDPDLRVIVAGKNFNGFDRLFLDRLPLAINYHHRVLDPMPLFVRPGDKEPPNLAECAKRAGVEFKGTGYHTAVSDAIMVVELLRKGWNK